MVAGDLIQSYDHVLCVKHNNLIVSIHLVLYIKLVFVLCICVKQSLGCTLYAMCFYESPFEKVHQRGDSVALAVMAANIKVPDKNPCVLLL